MGLHCAVAVPHGKETVEHFQSFQFEPVLFEEVEKGRFRFPDGRGPDIVHAWTPREKVRRFCHRVAARYRFRQFVHMEDNEWHVLARLTGTSLDRIKRLSPDDLDAFVPESLSHPERGMDFMGESAGITLIIDKLREIVPADVPTHVFWPSAQPEIFFERPLPKVDGRELGVPEGHTVIVYPGNVHPANAREVRSLYVAVAILNREGFPVTLVRAGEDYATFLGHDDSWVRPYVIDLGLRSRHEVSSVMAAADLFVQPGRPDVFNDYRFPSKLPEFLSIGRPVILPASNVALAMEHGRHGWILQEANAVEIAGAVRKIMGDGELYRKLAAGALEFFHRRLNWTKTAKQLVEFYGESR